MSFVKKNFENCSRAKKGKTSKSSGHRKSRHRSLPRHMISAPQAVCTIHLDREMCDDDDNFPQQSTSSTMEDHDQDLHESNQRIDDDVQEIQPVSSMNSTHSQNPKSSSINTPFTQSHLLSIRASLQKGNILFEFERNYSSCSSSTRGRLCYGIQIGQSSRRIE